MRIAVLSDIHGNLEALEAVLADAQDQQARQFVCLGDIVGYGPNPVECVERIQSLNCPAVKGNHDQAAANHNFVLDHLHPDAQRSLSWTRTQLEEKHLNFLENLPLSRRVGRFSITHASPNRPAAWTYVNSMDDAAEAMEKQNARLCFIGHTHIPAAFCLQGESISEPGLTYFQLTAGAKYLINPGSIGQPRDGDVRAAYVIYDREAQSIEFRRVSYSLLSTSEKINDRGLGQSLATRLATAI